MADPDTLQLLFAAVLPAPFAFRLGYVVRDGRELWVGGLFLALGAAVAALACFLTGSLILALSAAVALTVLLAHARFLGAHRAPFPGAGEPASTASAAADAEPLSSLPPPDPLHAGMAFLGEMLETADRIGELRHKRRLRKVERQRAEREAADGQPQPERLAVNVRRDGPLRDFPKLPPPDHR